MTFALILACMGFVVAITYFAVATTNQRDRRSANRGASVAAATRVPVRAGKDRIRWVDSTQLSKLISSDPEILIFRLVDGNAAQGMIANAASSRLPGQLAVTLKELEETLAWIPRGSRVAVYRLCGIGWMLRRRLFKILRGHEAMLLSKASEFTGKFNQMAGERCS